MKLLQTHRSLAILFILSTALIASSCSSTDKQSSHEQNIEEMQNSMHAVTSDTENLIDQLDAISSSLKELTRSDQQDVQGAFDNYTKSVSKIDTMEKSFTKHLDTLNSRVNTYLAQWNNKEKSYENTDIQQSSDDRRASFKNTFQEILNQSKGLGSSLETFASDVNQIQKYMSNDLNEEGIESLSTLSQRTAMQGDSLKSELKTLQNAIQKAQSVKLSGITQN